MTPVTAEQRHFVFVYGTLSDPGRLDMLLAPRRYTDPMPAAVLPDWRREECQYFYAVPEAGAEIEGVLIGPFTDLELAQLDRYEGCPQLYTREPVSALGRDRVAPEHPVWVYQGKHIRACHEAHKEGRGALDLCAGSRR